MRKVCALLTRFALLCYSRFLPVLLFIALLTIINFPQTLPLLSSPFSGLSLFLSPLTELDKSTESNRLSNGIMKKYLDRKNETKCTLG